MRAVDGLGALGKALISLGCFFSFKTKQWWTSLMVQWLRIQLLMQGTWA